MSYVYLMESHGRYKIGKADDLSARLNTLRTSDPEIELVHAIRSRNAYRLEMQLHAQFDGRRIWPDREWFALKPEEVAWIKSLEGGFRPRQWRLQWKRLARGLRPLLLAGLAAGIVYLAAHDRNIIHLLAALPYQWRTWAPVGAWLLVWGVLGSLSRR